MEKRKCRDVSLKHLNNEKQTKRCIRNTSLQKNVDMYIYGILNNKAFTLVELIVVITILAILATIGFVSFSGYLAGTRDTNRIAQLKSMSNALELYRTKKDLPIPDNKVDVKAGSKIIAYQGDIGKNVLETIEYTESGLDPKYKEYFSYYLTKNKKYFQLMAFLEEENKDVKEEAFKAPDKGFGVFATDYSNKYPFVKGKKLGILTDSENNPIQKIEEITSSGYLDISDLGDTEYKSIIANDETISGTGTALASTNPIGSCKRIKQIKGGSADGVYTIDPEGNGTGFKVYCDMTTDGGGWTLVNKTYLDNTNPGRTINGIDQGWINNDMNISKILNTSVKTDGLTAVAGHKLSKFNKLLNGSYILKYEFISADGGTEKRKGFIFSNDKNVFLKWQVDTPTFEFCDSLNKTNCDNNAKWVNGGNSGGATRLYGSQILDSRFSHSALHYRYNGPSQSICSSTSNSSWWPDNGYDGHWGNGQRTWVK